MLDQKDENFVLNQGRLEAVMLREEKIKKLEHQLDLREQEIKDRERVIRAKEIEVAQKRLEEELKLEEVRLENRKKLEVLLRDGLLQKFKKPKKTKDKT